MSKKSICIGITSHDGSSEISPALVVSVAVSKLLSLRSNRWSWANTAMSVSTVMSVGAGVCTGYDICRLQG